MIPRLLLALSITTVLAAQPADLVATVNATPYDAQLNVGVTIEVETKVALADPERITLRFGGDGLRVTSVTPGAGMTCDTTPSIVCQLAPMPAGGKATLAMQFEHDPTKRAPYVEAILVWNERGQVPVVRRYRKDVYRYVKEFVVTNGDDEGPGSLRQAILDANDFCYVVNSPCLVRFEVGEVFPRTPLPMITGGELVLEGPATIDGSLMERPANGITVGNTTVVLRDVTIRAFPENGVEVIGGNLRVDSSAITGNGSRAVVLLSAATNITDSVLSDNGRSGLFINVGRAVVERNRIENNGATGVFAARGGSFAILRDNVIADNAHFGVAFHRNTWDIDVFRNQITGNRLGPIDIGLDGPSLFNEPAYPVNGPTLHSATYDAATNTTTVRGRLEAPFYFRLSYELHFYTATGANEPDQYLGGIQIRQPDFTFTARGDLRGRFITANTIRWLEDDLISRGTSELSTTPVEVQ